MGPFWETTSGLFPCWFDSGYIFSAIFYVKMDLGSRGSCCVFRSREEYTEIGLVGEMTSRPFFIRAPCIRQSLLRGLPRLTST